MVICDRISFFLNVDAKTALKNCTKKDVNIA